AWFPDGAIPTAGTLWAQRDQARLLRRLIGEGPEALYRGELPRTIVRQIRERGGILSEADFERYAPALVEPLAIDYRGWPILTPPPPSGGITALQILKTLETFDLSGVPPWGAEYFDLFVSAVDLAWHDRMAELGDPDWTAIPVARLLSEETAKASAARIRRGD